MVLQFVCAVFLPCSCLSCKAHSSHGLSYHHRRYAEGDRRSMDDIEWRPTNRRNTHKTLTEISRAEFPSGMNNLRMYKLFSADFVAVRVAMIPSKDDTADSSVFTLLALVKLWYTCTIWETAVAIERRALR
eukprot:728540-Amphidinium_carterae.1